MTAYISEESLAAKTALPSRLLTCSTQAGWRSLLVRSYEDPTNADPFDTLLSPDLVIVLLARGRYRLESFKNGHWRAVDYRPHLGGMTAPGRSSKLRWKSLSSEPKESLHIHIPRKNLLGAAEELFRSGTPSLEDGPDALLLDDPVIASISASLLTAAKSGLPDLYAQSATQFMATHLLSKRAGRSTPSVREMVVGKLNDRRLQRVLEYMRVSFAEPLTLEQLAREAGVSQFHFVYLFKTAVGHTPHQHIIELRLQSAAGMLANTDRSIMEVALACGYKTSGHFSTAFSRRFGRSPLIYRQELTK